MHAWCKVLQITVVLSPILANDKVVTYENVGFALGKDFRNIDEDKLWMRVLEALPWNIINFFEKDISSARMAPLLYNFLRDSTNQTGRYIIAANLVRQKPDGWSNNVKEYMLTLDKNSFYLFAIFRDLVRERQIGFCNSKQVREIEELAAVAIAKHETGAKRPNKKLIKKAADQIFKEMRKRERRDTD